MVVSFSEEQPTRYKYDISKSTIQCDKEADIITANVYEQLKLDNNSNSKKKRGTKKNKKWSPRMYLVEDEKQAILLRQVVKLIPTPLPKPITLLCQFVAVRRNKL